MSQILYQSLLITAVGMGLVFAAILLLWLLMAAVVRFAGTDPVEEEEAGEETETAAPGESMQQKKRRAAAMAVAVALANQSDAGQPHAFPLPPTAMVSAWQAIMRTRMLNKRGPTR